MRDSLGIKRQVLIVEDERLNRIILKNIIGDEYDILEAKDGKEALDMVYWHADTLSLVLLDLILPNLDGYQILEIMQSDDKLSRIPVIVCTAAVESEVKCLKMGAIDFIAKPYIHPEVIKARVQRTIEFSEGSGIIKATQNDPLTGLYTTEYFMEYALLKDQYHPNMQMDAMVFNINKLHILNELDGRDKGDEVLRRIASSLKSIADLKEGIAGRNSGDEFLLYIPHESNYCNILKYIDDKLNTITTNLRISVRMGVYPCVDKKLKMEDRIDRARSACNTVRGKYNIHYAVYDEKMHRKEAYNEELLKGMEEGLESGVFVIYYQPKYSVQGGRNVLSSAEALVRWNHPEFGMISPAEFIPLFEKNGLIHKLDHYVWNEVARQIGEWMIKYDFELPVSVNVSRVDMRATDLEDEISDLVEQNWITPDLLHLEITESAYVDNAEQMIETVNCLRNRGFSIEMDDFGTGYSSLNMISALPIDVLKLDMQFIKNIHISDKEMHLVEFMLDLASYMEAKVVAEGVENVEQYELLKNAGCDQIQGYYFSRPCPPIEFEKLIREELSFRQNVG